MRQYRTAFANVYRASVVGSSKTMAWIDDKDLTKRYTTVATQLEWFDRFTQGCKKSMGGIYKPDLALTSALMVAYLKAIEVRIDEAKDEMECHLWTLVGAYFIREHQNQLWTENMTSNSEDFFLFYEVFLHE